MSLVYLTNQRYVGLNVNGYPSFADAWLKIKNFMKNTANWLIVQSAAQTFSSTTDIILDSTTNPGGMSSPVVWWVMRDPAGVREFLFYRSAAVTDVNNHLSYANMAIAYSAKDRFSTIFGLGGNTVSATNPPIANDMVWLHTSDNWVGSGGGTLAVPGLMNDSVNWGGAIGFSDNWNVHMFADTSAQYPFYFWFTRINDTTGFFCMDTLQDTHSLDQDNVLFYSFPQVGGIKNDINFASCQYPLRSWFRKPANFTNRADFAEKISNNEARFLRTNLVKYTYNNNLYRNSNAQYSTAAPAGLPTCFYDGKDELFPATYIRASKNGNIDNILSIPPSFKGTSTFIKLISTARNQFDTFNVAGERDKIAIGSSPILAFPWDGSIINV
jgi:hypothetical protein